MTRCRLFMMLAAVGGILLSPVAAHAGPGYPIEPPASAVSDGTVAAGESVVFSGKGFLPGEPITIDVSFGMTGAALHTNQLAPRAMFVAAALRTVTASSSGTFSTRLDLEQRGRATLTATGTVSGVVVSERVTVVVARPGAPEAPGVPGVPAAPEAPDGGALPTTGQSMQHWLTLGGLGLGAILVGGLFVVLAIRSRDRRVRRS